MPRITVHPSQSTWRVFGFEDCGSLTIIADKLIQHMDLEFRSGLLTELCISEPYIAMHFSKQLPAYWCIKVFDIAEACIKEIHGYEQPLLLHLIE